MKRPSFQFYPSDWLRDTALRTCSVGARGLWIDMICYMHEGNPYGVLKVGNKVILAPNLAAMIGATLEDTEGWLHELESAGVFDRGENGEIMSRRMIRDENLRNIRASGGKLGGNPDLLKRKVNLTANLASENKVKQKPTPSSSSSSSSSLDSNGAAGVWEEPSRDQVIEAARNCGLTEQQADIWLNETLARPIDPFGRWTDRNGRPIGSWQHALGAWAGRFKENNNKKGSTTHASNSTNGRERVRRYHGVGDPSRY